MVLRAISRSVAVLGAFTLVASGFLPWSEDGVVALDLRAVDWEVGAQPTVALVLIVLAALPAVAGVAFDAVWPRLVAAAGAGALVLWWLADADGGTLTSGVWTALAGAVALLLSAGLGPARRERRRSYDDRDHERDPGHEAQVHA
ncbi:MAG: hypothetical protein R3343_01625 [Nitriliruptorales bacterium]|nr:hypothetical protein [Nitriliruptorales bacterium]